MKIFDIETDGLLRDLTKIHTLTIYDTDTGEYTRYDKEYAYRGIEELNDSVVCGHNVIAFDVPAIKKLYPSFSPKKVLDTMVMARLAYADIKLADMARFKAGTLDGKLIGSHSLKAYGQRLKILKGDFGETTDWAEWSQEMSDYCEQDVRVTVTLWEKLEAKIKSGELSKESLELEHTVQEIICRQIEFGFDFDEEAANDLYAELVAARSELEAKVINAVPPWFTRNGKEKLTNKNRRARVKMPEGIKLHPERVLLTNMKLKEDEIVSYYYEGYEYQPIKLVTFNPMSRDHIIRLFTKKYGWQPKEYTDNGKPKVDESILKKLPYPEAKVLADLFLIQKRIGQLAEGNQAWLQQVGSDGRMHGYVNTNGAVTGRMTHSNPNVAQVPSVKLDDNDRPIKGFEGGYGYECRSLFRVPKGYRLVGCDASGLELRCLAHYMAKYDNGAYGEIILNGDIHTVNQKAAGLPTRSNAKTFIYGFLYGAGDEKIGTIIGKGRQAGAALKKRFLKRLPALKYLLEAVQAKAEDKGYLIGLDGRRLTIRSSHAALNTLLQSAGAIIMKQYLVFLDRNLKEAGVTYEFVANIHDEVQMQVLEADAYRAAEIAEATFKDVTEHFNFRCRLDGEAKVGRNWAETH